ncbi:MAG: arylsulfatase [Phycisphaeraceae bacterium]
MHRLLICFAALLGLALPCAARQDPPNILYIIVDDMGYGDLGCFGSEAVHTPNIDRLATRGMRFTDAYAGCTVCAPTRSTLMTGYHMGHTYMRLNTGGVPIRDEEVTVAEVLKAAGYRTGGFGKWGLGDLGTPGVPEKQGFDVFFGYYHQIHAHYFCPEYLIRNSEKVELPGNKGFYDKHPRRNAGPFPRVDPQTGQVRQFTQDVIFDEMKRFLRASAASGEPFFCYAPWTPPHAEYKLPEDDPAWARYKDKPWGMQAKVHAAFCTLVDRHVGQTLALLDELGVADNTIVFFTTDNGASQRFEGTLDSSGPLRGRKRDMHEGGLRTPLIVAWPGRIKPGTTSALPTYSPDVMPTLAALAGPEAQAAVPGDIDGVSIVPTLLGAGEQALHDHLYWEWSAWDWGKQRPVPGGLMQAVRKGKWKAVKMGADQPLLLYDLSVDVGEQNNLADEHPRVAEQMAELMKRSRTEMLPQREPDMPKGKRYR